VGAIGERSEIMKPYRIFSLIIILLLLSSFFGPGVQPASAAGVTFIVNWPGEGADAVLNGICATAGAVCTLRAAIQEANFDPNPNAIHFDLPGSGIRQIAITSGSLPTINGPLLLDGTSQPNCAAPCIGLSGASLGGSPAGLTITGNNSAIKGFVITSFLGPGILMNGSGNFIQGNVIGFFPGSAWPVPNKAGIWLYGNNNTIGGTTPALRNVISGNTENGILVAKTAGTSGNVILGNYIGTDQSGMLDRGNSLSGIVIAEGVTYTTIGGTLSGARNVISGNGASGIRVFGTHTTIRGNFIGTRADGIGPLGNSEGGIILYWTAASTIIGGNGGAAKNKIAYNIGSGIMVTSSATSRTTMRRNSLFSNTSLGIDLDGNGVTLNDALDGDSGPNGFQNFPVISKAFSSTDKIIARLYSKPNNTYIIEFFSSPAGTCDAQQHGEGKKFLGSKSVTTDGTGYVHVAFISPVGFSMGSVITATATDSAGRTSEFSKCRTAG
jgi:hypothetical protein